MTSAFSPRGVLPHANMSRRRRRVPGIMSGAASHPTIGPIEFAVFEFPAGEFSGGIASALGDLVDRGIVSILDLLMVGKDGDGNLEVLEIADIDDDVAARFAQVDGEVMWLLSQEDVAAAAGTLQTGSTGVLVVWENTWARDLKSAVAARGGRLVVHDRLDSDAVSSAIAETPGG